MTIQAGPACNEADWTRRFAAARRISSARCRHAVSITEIAPCLCDSVA